MDAVVVDSPNAIINHSGGTFRAVGGIDLKRGVWRASAGATIDSDVRVTGGGAGLTLENGAAYRGAVSLIGNASLGFGSDQTFSGPAK